MKKRVELEVRGKIGIVVGIALTALLISISAGQAEIVGEVSTSFKLLGANDKIVIEAFDDPDIKGATCYLSRAKTGGIKGTVGLAEDKSDASLACRQTWPYHLTQGGGEWRK